jgi:hypothetical protein
MTGFLDSEPSQERPLSELIGPDRCRDFASLKILASLNMGEALAGVLPMFIRDPQGAAWGLAG